MVLKYLKTILFFSIRPKEQNRPIKIVHKNLKQILGVTGKIIDKVQLLIKENSKKYVEDIIENRQFR